MLPEPYGAYDLHPVARLKLSADSRTTKWAASASVTRRGDGHSLAMAIAWGNEFDTEGDALAFALRRAKDWANANPPEAVD